MTKTPLCPGKVYTLQEQTDNHDTAWPGPQGGGRAGGLARAPATSFPTMLHTTGQPKPTTRPGHVLSTCTPTPTCALSLPKTLPKSPKIHAGKKEVPKEQIQSQDSANLGELTTWLLAGTYFP